MTIKGLQVALKKYAKTVPSKDFAGKRIAFDANLLVNQMVRIKSATIVNSRGEPIQHIQGILYRVLNIIESGIAPVFVFDGKPPDEKAPVLEARREAADKVPGPTSSTYIEVKELLRLLGVQCVDAAGEAEAYAARMAYCGRVSAVATDDLDALVFGAPVVIRGVGQGDTVQVYVLEDILRELALTREQFIDVCVLSGGDYHAGAEGIGVASALRLVKQYGTGAAAIGAGATKMENFTEIRRLYARPVAKSDHIDRARKPQPAELERFLLEKGLDVKRVRTAVGRLVTLLEKTI